MKKIIFSGHLGFGDLFEPFLIISQFVTISHSFRHEKIYNIPNFRKIGTKTTLGHRQYMITFLGNKTRLRVPCDDMNNNDITDKFKHAYRHVNTYIHSHT